jgi:hypothetical protein
MLYNTAMDTIMNNTISQDSIDSLNAFIANYERERDARLERERIVRAERNAELMRECERIRGTLSYKVTELACDVAEGFMTTLEVIFKVIVALMLLLSPALLEALINSVL